MFRLIFHHLKRMLFSLDLFYLLLALLGEMFLLYVKFTSLHHLTFATLMHNGSYGGIILAGLLLFTCSKLAHLEDEKAIVSITKRREQYAVSQLFALFIITFLVNIIEMLLLASIMPRILEAHVVGSPAFEVLTYLLGYSLMDIFVISVFALLCLIVQAMIARFYLLLVILVAPYVIQKVMPLVNSYNVIGALMIPMKKAVFLRSVLIASFGIVIVVGIYHMISRRRCLC